LFHAVRRLALILSVPISLLILLSAQTAPTFETSVQPVLRNTCAPCHNPRLASGGLDLAPFENASSLASDRAAWQTILARVKTGEMPPPPAARPATLPAMIAFLEDRLNGLDNRAPIDPGHVVARHLTRAEYRNTIRDLLGVDFQTSQEFPADDTGDGFDNLGTVLTVSPLLAEKYLAAAESISARALGLVTLPKPITHSFADDANYNEGAPITGNSGSAHRAGTSFIEVTHRIEYDGEYVIQAGLAGERGPEGKPVTLGFWMDGALLHSEEVQTTPPNSVYFSPFEMKEFRVFLPEGLHQFRLGFANDPVGAAMPRNLRFKPKSNKYPQFVGFLGPYAPAQPLASRRKILICDPVSGTDCVERIVTSAARRAWRRPVTKAEIAPLMGLVGNTVRQGLSLYDGIQTALEAILVSPQFLFRIERDADPGNPAAIHRVSDVELASRLSYFLWNSMPDDELLSLAEAGKLSNPATLDAQTRRMIADPRSSALAQNFAGQWLELRNLDSIQPDPVKFPDWTPELKEAMRTESRMFFDSVFRENRPISDFLDARYTFLNELLAKFYGIDGVTGPEFRRVDLTTDQRGGVLGQAAVLAVSSYPSRTSVVLRGKYVLDNILGSPPPPQPANVPSIDDGTIGATLSVRQRMEQHRTDPVCASCHSKMDPLGFGLENYDAIGKWRAAEGKFPVDSTGTLPDGTAFANPAQMRQVLAAHLPQFADCLAGKMMIYALGRGLHDYDRRTLATLTRSWQQNGYRFQDLIFEIVRGTPFQSRRGEEKLVGQAGSLRRVGNPPVRSLQSPSPVEETP